MSREGRGRAAACAVRAGGAAETDRSGPPRRWPAPRGVQRGGRVQAAASGQAHAGDRRRDQARAPWHQSVLVQRDCGRPLRDKVHAGKPNVVGAGPARYRCTARLPNGTRAQRDAAKLGLRQHGRRRDRRGLPPYRLPAEDALRVVAVPGVPPRALPVPLLRAGREHAVHVVGEGVPVVPLEGLHLGMPRRAWVWDVRPGRGRPHDGVVIGMHARAAVVRAQDAAENQAVVLSRRPVRVSQRHLALERVVLVDPVAESAAVLLSRPAGSGQDARRVRARSGQPRRPRRSRR